MNTSLIIANVLVLLTFIVHTFVGDRKYKSIEPEKGDHSNQVKWTMGRGAFHIVSADFFLATIGLTLINFTGYFSDRTLLLSVLSVYFLSYGFAFLITLIISRKFPNSFIKLWQWLLMFIISGLIYYGTN
jgi:hypothetical protein